LATSGEHDTAYFLNFFKETELFPDGADFKAASMIAGGNKVAAEAELKPKQLWKYANKKLELDFL
tara:strand:- start:112 stop:306 length:195 start_codon:yes stop_codon:yes gene_type:complete